jgi:hypothetical protein
VGLTRNKSNTDRVIGICELLHDSHSRQRENGPFAEGFGSAALALRDPASFRVHWMRSIKAFVDRDDRCRAKMLAKFPL